MFPSEELLHFIWKNRLFTSQKLYTSSQEEISIVKTGLAHSDAGPDFKYAQLQIGSTLWFGHVEIHIRASDWYKHGHHRDAAYQNVILHVVWEADIPVYYSPGKQIPTLVLSGLISEYLIYQYTSFQLSVDWIPCEQQLLQKPTQPAISFFSGLALERLEERKDYFLKLLHSCQGDWEKLFFMMLARSFGFRVNGFAMERLASIISLTILAKYREQSISIDAIFFGQAGLLRSIHSEEDYVQQLQEQYRYLKKLHKLPEMEPGIWKFLRMRPYNFPTFRIAQLASFYKNRHSLFGIIKSFKTLKKLKDFFVTMELHDFWEFHFTFVKRAKQPHHIQLTEFVQEHMIINVVSPLYYTYGTYLNRSAYREFALEILNELPAERNQLIAPYANLGLHAETALDSQALLHLKRNYCMQKKCLFCQIGSEILNRKGYDT